MIGLRTLIAAPRRKAGAIAKPGRYRLGAAIVADPLHHRITLDGSVRQVEPRVMQLLDYFASRPGEVISKEQLRRDVWGTHVVDEAIHRAVSLLRSALGDSSRDAKLIQTLPRHGYCLLVVPSAIVDAAPALPDRRTAAMAVMAIAIGSAALMFWRPGDAGPDERAAASSAAIEDLDASAKFALPIPATVKRHPSSRPRPSAPKAPPAVDVASAAGASAPAALVETPAPSKNDAPAAEAPERTALLETPAADLAPTGPRRAPPPPSETPKAGPPETALSL